MPYLGNAIADLQEEYPNIPIDYLGAKLYAELREYSEMYSGAATGVSPEVWLHDMLESSDFISSLEAVDAYFAETLPTPDPVTTPPTNTNTNDDDPTVDPVTTPTPAPEDVTAPAPGVAWKDPSTGRTHVQDGPNHRGNGTQAPVLLDLDGDGIEVVFGEDIYFDTDGDGFVEKTAWAAAGDGFYKEVA